MRKKRMKRTKTYPRTFNRRQAIMTAAFGGVGAAATWLVWSGRQESPAAPASDFSARFASFEAADEPNGDLSKVVWPPFVTRANPEVKRLYEFNIVNGELMRYMPCFCGCHLEDGHRNNRDCYVEAVNPDRSVVLDPMAPT